MREITGDNFESMSVSNDLQGGPEAQSGITVEDELDALLELLRRTREFQLASDHSGERGTPGSGPSESMEGLRNIE